MHGSVYHKDFVITAISACGITILIMSLCRGYVGIHSSGFRDFLLKPELLRAIVDSGFEHPSEGNLSIAPNRLYLSIT